ncbi:MAG: pyridoxamine 5'-phosphate oxidase family protein [Chloroflexi bacterium]|nr:pyridoxamine 5'-phosphate oxidase family protein [Chloroflexota bacterium]
MKSAINNALTDKVPCIVSTASADGEPGIGYRSSVMDFGADSLAYWERSFRQGVGNFESNPHLVILYRNPATRQAWKFFRRAELHRNDEIREEEMGRTVKAELDHDPEQNGVAFVVRLDRVEIMAGEVLMSTD